MAKYIKIRTSFEGFHYWEDAPDNFKYLKNTHRHIFHVVVVKEVSHGDREIEFIEFKRQISAYLNRHFKGYVFPFSCEHIAQCILEDFDAFLVEVSEDGENGAVVDNYVE